ncbi:MAG TPA: hypothetical protein VGK47_14410 [Nitrososphaeraceae archaeon]
MKIKQTKNVDLIRSIVTNPILWKQAGHDGDPIFYTPYLGNIWLIGQKDNKNVGLLELKQITAITYEAHIRILPEFQGTGESVEFAQNVRKFIKNSCKNIHNLVCHVPMECKYVINFLSRLNLKVNGLIRNGIIYNNTLQDLIIFQLEV